MLFRAEISHRQIEALGRRLEAEGILQSVGGPHPRRIVVDEALQFIERWLPPRDSHRDNSDIGGDKTDDNDN
ncbi:MAG: hypothetical protein Kow0031_17790 [Anaerolineae bacterium]